MPDDQEPLPPAEPGALDAAARSRQLRRAVVASAVGTAIEWYDFFLYGVAAALVFPARFFPEADRASSSTKIEPRHVACSPPG